MANFLVLLRCRCEQCSLSLQTGDLDLLGFRRDIGRVYHTRYAQRKASEIQLHTGRVPVLDKRISLEVRFDNVGHFVDYVENQRKCAFSTKKCNFVCIKCNMPLNPKFCFIQFHQK